MTSKEFTLWLKGFTEGVHEFNITPKQWDNLKEKLAKVSDEPQITTAIGIGGWGIPNGTITTTPGSGYITIANPNIAAFSGSYNPSTTTLWNPSGSAWSYTTTNGPFSTQDDNSLKPTKQTKFKKRKAKSVKEWEDTHDLGGQD